ncbi:leucine-rich repeat domain-containing protein [Bacteroidales bacterium OttesenSCG-928-A17]|nr:leucine-rich repeat domain-containing protein [Bacteroidales bacterium OttesenSCG-928-A17]
MKQKLYTILLSALVLATFTFNINAQSGTDGNISWKIENGTLTISGEGAMNDYSSSSIPWKNYQLTITSVVIEDGITTVGESSFGMCLSLNSATLPESLTSIGAFAFFGCSSLDEITIPEKVVTYKDMAFMNCSSLTEVTVLNPVPAEIKDNVFGSVNLANATLNVPAGAYNAYDGAAIWKEFGTIVELADESNDFTLYYSTTDGKLHKGSVSGDEITEGFTGTYTGNGATLTLDNFEFETTAATAIEFFQDITLNLVGDSYITSTYVNEEKNENKSYGIYTQRSLTIQSDSDGTLTATGGTVTNGNSSGVWTTGTTSTLTINSGTLEGVGGTADALMGGSQGIRINLGSLDISGGYLIGRNSSAANSHGVSISNNGSLTMSGGSLTTTAADAYAFSVGLDVSGSVNITGGTITATGGIAEECSSYGIYVYGDFSLTGGTVEATCGTGGESQAGIFIYDGTSTTPGATIVGGANADDTDELTFSNSTYKSNGVIANYVKINGGSSAIDSIENNNSLNIYPNPATESFCVNGLIGEAAVSVYTLAGHEIKTTTVNGNETIVVDFASGIYFVKIKTAAGEETCKLIVK